MRFLRLASALLKGVSVVVVGLGWGKLSVLKAVGGVSIHSVSRTEAHCARARRGCLFFYRAYKEVADGTVDPAGRVRVSWGGHTKLFLSSRLSS